MRKKKKSNVIRIECVTDNGGCVVLNREHGVRVSYAVATAGDLEPPELFYASVQMPDGRVVNFFANRESGLVTVNICGRNTGNEVCRMMVSDVEHQS